jgi:hypothetical protein
MEDHHGQLLGSAEGRATRERRTASEQQAPVMDIVVATRQ